MDTKRFERGLWPILGLVLVLSLLSSAAPKGTQTVEEQIQELREQNLKLKQQIEELNAKLDLLLSRMEKLEQANSAVKPADTFEEKPIATEGKGPAGNLQVVKVERTPEKTGPLVIQIIDEDKKKAEPVKVEPGKDSVAEAKKLITAKKYLEAEKLIEDRLNHKPEAKESCQLLYYLGQSRAQSGKGPEAAKAYLELSDRYPACELAPEALFKSGEICEKMGEKGNARELYQELVSLYPFSKYANLAQEKLKK